MNQLTEIRWHGRGGQGGKTAAILLAEVLSSAGKYVQAFPEYGPERMGAPVLAFDRISDEPITVHCHVTDPQIVVVLDATLLAKVDVTAGLAEDGILVINTSKPPDEVRGGLNLGDKPVKVFTVDASQIALDVIGRDFPNTPMVGALIRATGMMNYAEFAGYMEHELQKKFRTKPEVVQGNLEAMERAYREVQE